MSRSYDLNTDSARQANTSNRITETGKYIGKFTRAEAVKSRQNTEGIEFTFESNEGQSADFLTLWTINGEGKEIFGMKILNALMTCLRVKSIKPTSTLIEKFDNSVKKKVNATIYADLMNKQIGLLLQREEYEKQNGAIGNKVNIYACFDAQTEMMAGEILDRAPKAEQLTKLMLSLRDRPLQLYKRPTHTQATQQFIDDMNDDIPF